DGPIHWVSPALGGSVVMTASVEPAAEQERILLQDDLGLSRWQAEIMDRVLHAQSDERIARELDIAVPMVRTYMSNLLHTFDVSDRVELSAYASLSLWACRNNV
ncbi:MAG: response regulator transcription factor, partial [Phycisphaerales bacterium]